MHALLLSKFEILEVVETSRIKWKQHKYKTEGLLKLKLTECTCKSFPRDNVKKFGRPTFFQIVVAWIAAKKKNAARESEFRFHDIKPIRCSWRPIKGWSNALAPAHCCSAQCVVLFFLKKRKRKKNRWRRMHMANKNVFPVVTQTFPRDFCQRHSTVNLQNSKKVYWLILC